MLFPFLITPAAPRALRPASSILSISLTFKRKRVMQELIVVKLSAPPNLLIKD
jgi:hypothetical protein